MAMLDPKIVGTWNLHTSTKNLPLDFFVMFSSVAALFGNMAQSSYAGANLFMDSFASYRRSLGLPATTVNWGVLADVGFVARNQEFFTDKFDTKGIMGVRPSEAFRSLKFLISPEGAAYSQIGVIRANLAQWAQMYPILNTHSRYVKLIDKDKAAAASQSDSASSSSASSFLAGVMNLPEKDMHKQIVDKISSALARKL